MEIIRHQILIQTLYFLKRLPTRQLAGVENRHEVYGQCSLAVLRVNPFRGHVENFNLNQSWLRV